MRIARWLVLALLLSGCTVSGVPISPHGRRVSTQSGTERVQGELLAVRGDTIWMMHQARARAVVLAPGQRVQVQRHDFNFRRTMRWMGLAGLGTGLALMVACNSYEASEEGGGDDSGCIAVLPVTVLTFGAFGFLFGGANEYSSVHRLTVSDTARLRAFSRYPQGLPDSFRANGLTAPP